MLISHTSWPIKKLIAIIKDKEKSVIHKQIDQKLMVDLLIKHPHGITYARYFFRGHPRDTAKHVR